MNQETLKAFVQRRHPQYQESLPHWEFLESCYEGGREWFVPNIFRYMKEGDLEYKDRIDRCYRFNHTREVVDLVDKYLFKMEVARGADAPDSVKKFWKSATLQNMPIKDYMKQVSKLTSIYGRIWIVTDTTKTESVQAAPVTKIAEEDDRAYSYIVTPENACDMSYDDEGRLNWILIHEQTRDDLDPLNSSGETLDRFRLWEREQYTIFNIVPKRGTGTVEDGSNFAFAKQSADAIRSGAPVKSDTNWEVSVDGPYAHDFGEVPVFAADNVLSSELYSATALIDDVAYLDRAVANYLSNLDAIIQDQTFSQLVMPAQGISPGEEGYDKLIEMGTKRVFTYDGEGGRAPEYISPDVRQAEIILKVINKIINEIYHTVGLAGERTKEDNAQGIDNSSGVAKAYDFERVNSLLAAKADSLERTENKLCAFIAKWNGEEIKGTEENPELVAYPENFDVRGLYDEFDIAARLSLIVAPDIVRRTQMEQVIDKLFPKLKKELREKMISELKTWPPELPVDPETGQAISKAGNNMLANKLVKETGK